MFSDSEFRALPLGKCNFKGDSFTKCIF